MFRVICLLTLVGFLSGCSVDAVLDNLADEPQLSPEVRKKIDTLSNDLHAALKSKDWAAVAALYWSGAKMTPEKAQEAYESHLAEAGPLEVSDIYYYEYDTSDLLDELSAEELKAVGAPEEMWRGYAEISYGSDDFENGLEVMLEVGEEDGKYVILDLYDIYGFDDR
ncbi:hypothetical protein [Blastopirellula marina]|uniref:DUF3828 domain-containing protein n=1 Tax=Blastopirellula marina TaxID=124 RepID=A0A2S8GU61_9BACT|nr:hypothetical protein [Blastopirellula marina]PQO35168.1 hypothetical protein C5Y98_14555 [Blastopirellula marina]PQO47959.1 hypothetical protein C5Y93_00805 [Blastopirellula marina]PTL43917.1 hypothetical protein C5Y97_14565 [Blastopirellula marina]